MIYPFSSYRYKCENLVVNELLEHLEWPDDISATVHGDAVKLTQAVRTRKDKGGPLEAFLQEFSLSTDEGLAMMCLAEALLRIPDVQTANALIRDKVAASDWLMGQDHESWLAKATLLGMSAVRLTLDSVFSRLGEPIIREAMVRAMQIMGQQFVLGTSIEDALEHAVDYQDQGYRLSYDMLGEGARDAKTAQAYYDAYAHAIEVIAKGNRDLSSGQSSISVKLSALHPRYTYTQHERCVPEITERLLALCKLCARHDMELTVDAEEADRLDLSVQIIEAIIRDPVCSEWGGFGLAVQAYQKRALGVIDYFGDLVRSNNQSIHIRLVKGAYWDSEIKIAQMGGFPEYPVFTRKRNTDLSYLLCTQRLFKHADHIYPKLATHNAHTLMAVKHLSQGKAFEFQRLHGMGEGLYEAYFEQYPDDKASIYAPVGPHRDLLPYLVRRLLENGANSSFVNKLLDESVDEVQLCGDPVLRVRESQVHRHDSIPLPARLFGEERKNSKGYDLSDPLSSVNLLKFISNYNYDVKSFSVINGQLIDVVDESTIENAIESARKIESYWDSIEVENRCIIIERFADFLERDAESFISMLVHEAGKTIQDSCDELREAVDFCRYYAQQGRTLFSKSGQVLRGYTGEHNRLIMEGRGVFLCISPWNFPLAIFTGQVIAALVAGNSVIAKPAPQTPCVAQKCVQLMHKAGIPLDVLHLVQGGGDIGSMLVKQQELSGVVFTGSTRTAKVIQKGLIEQHDSLIPLIAETGGLNAMIIDSSALLEQAVDDVIHSAFGSAGQRCSALRVVYVQDDIADSFISLLSGAMDELVVDDPSNLSADIGYIIDNEAKIRLNNHKSWIVGRGQKIHVCLVDDHERLFAPLAVEIKDSAILKEEVFGPVLHVVRYDGDLLDVVINQINASGYGLTFGVHSRIETVHEQLIEKIRVGNIYVNRSMTGAVVGVHPFGGMGLSGTGPKAGGPYYLHAFGVEKHISTDVTASGGNTTLVNLTDD